MDCICPGDNKNEELRRNKMNNTPFDQAFAMFKAKYPLKGKTAKPVTRLPEEAEEQKKKIKKR